MSETNDLSAPAPLQPRLKEFERQVVFAPPGRALFLFELASPEQRERLAPLMRLKISQAHGQGWTPAERRVIRRHFGINLDLDEPGPLDRTAAGRAGR